MLSAEPPPGALVLGMHRSGTSAATRLLNLAGLALCSAEDLMRSTQGNAKGHWESQTMFRLNDELLEQMGRAWWCPPPSELRGLAAALGRIETAPQRAAEVFERVHPTWPWVWKDPRTTALLTYWRAALGRPPVGVAMVRHPLEVAASLSARHGWSTEFGVALWERYNRLLLTQALGMRLFVSDYDSLVSDPAGWYAQVGEFLTHVGLDALAAAPVAEAVSFVEPALRHATGSLAELRVRFPLAAQVWEALLASVGEHEDFTPPVLPEESAWVEAALVAVGARKTRPLPQPMPVVASVVAADPAVGSLLPPWAERVEPAGRPDVLLRARGGLLVSPPAPGLPPDWADVAVSHLASGRPAGVSPADGGQAVDRRQQLRTSGVIGRGGGPVSVILAATGSELGLPATVDRLLAGLDATCELIVILTGTSTPVQTAAAEGRLTVLAAEPGSSPAHHRAQGAAAASRGVLVFCEPGIELGPGWRAALTGALGDLRTGVVGPVAAGAEDRSRWFGGQRLVDRMLTTDWLAAPARRQEVPLLSQHLFAVRAEVLELVGGLDPAYACARCQAADLCVRVRRAGLGCVVEPAAQIVCEPDLEPDGGPSRCLADLMRLASVHLTGTEHQDALALWRTHPDFPAAAARVALSDAAQQRQALRIALPRAAAEAVPGIRVTPRVVEPGTQRLVFVGGVHQSGGNVLTGVLGTHPEISSFAGTGKPDDEGQHLQTVLPPAKRHGGPGRFALDPACHLTASSPLNTPETAERLAAEWGKHWDLGRRFLVEHSPQNIVRMRLLRALFPDSYTVVVTRHPMAVAVATQEWRPDLSLSELVEHWLAAWETFCADCIALDRVIVVPYESLVVDGRAVLSAVGQRLGIENLGRSSDFVDPRVHRRTQEAWLTRRASVGPTAFGDLEERFGARVRRAGYELSDVSRCHLAMTAPSRRLP